MSLLIQYGHDEDAIGDYPLDKFRLYVESVRRLESGTRFSYVKDTTRAIAGVLGKGDTLKEHLKELLDSSGV